MNSTASSNKTCFNCGKPGHLSRDCESPMKKEERGQSRRVKNRKRNNDGFNKDCYNCGEIDHLAADCTLEKRDVKEAKARSRPPRKAKKCFNCDEEGHLAADCALEKRDAKDANAKSRPPRKAKKCFNCDEESHLAADCTLEKREAKETKAKSRPPKKAKKCFNCDEESHLAADCAMEKRYGTIDTKSKSKAIKKTGDRSAKSTKPRKNAVYTKKNTRLYEQADALIKKFEMVAHPEGGWYKELFKSEYMTSIYFLLKEGEVSHWHKIEMDEVIHYYRGAELEIEMSSDEIDVELAYIGPNFESGQQIQYTVPKNTWFTLRPLGAYSLIGTNCAPPFTFEILTQAEKDWKPLNSDNATKRSKQVAL